MTFDPAFFRRPPEKAAATWISSVKNIYSTGLLFFFPACDAQLLRLDAGDAIVAAAESVAQYTPLMLVEPRIEGVNAHPARSN